MPSSSGTYTLYTPGNPVVTGTTISSSWANNTLNDLAAAMTVRWPRDGTAPPTANMPMGAYKFTNVGAGSARTDSLNFGQVQDGGATYITGVAGTDTITGSIVTPTLAAYVAGQSFRFVAAGTNTGAATLNINSLGAKSITKNGATALAAGDIVSGAAYNVTYDGTQFQLNVPVSPASSIQNQTWVAFTTGGTSTAYTLTPSPAISAYTAGQSFFVTFNAASGASPTLQISGVASPPNLVYQQADGTFANIGAGQIPINHRSRVTLLSATQAWVEELPYVLFRGYIDGLTLSTAGSSTTMTIAAGQASDSTNAVMMSLSASLSKTTSAWAVGSGNGGLDTGTIANSTWYYWYIIRRPDTGVTDAVFSLSSSAPTLPTNYTQYRYIGAGLTNGSGQWTKFTQTGDEFWWDTPVLDFNGAGSTTAVSLTTSVPRGRKMKLLANVHGTTSVLLYLSDLANADLAPSASAAPLATLFTDGAAGQVTGVGVVGVWTNTLGQIRYRNSSTNTWRLATLGWQDLRGKNA